MSGVTIAEKEKGSAQSSVEAEYDLIREIIAGDKDKFRELLTRYRDYIYYMIYRQVGEKSTAEDLAQEVFIRAYTNLGKFRFEARFSTWLTRIALNTTNSYFSSRAYKERKRTNSTLLESQEMSNETENEQNYRDQVEEFQCALAKIKPKFREVIVLCGVEGKSYEQAASILGIPIGTIRSRLNTVRLLIRNAIDEQLKIAEGRES